MPTVRQNIAYAYNGFMSRHRLAAVHLIKSALAIVLISLLLETFLFNINYFTSANYNTISLNDKLTLQETVDDQYKVTAVNHVLEFSNLNTEVHNIWLNFDYRQPAQDLRVKIQFTDDAHHTYFDSTEYTVGVPPVGVSTLSDQSEYINLNTTGLVKNLRIEIAGDDVSYPIKLSDIVLNAHHPFDFNTTRFFVCMGLLALAFAFRPGSAIYRIGIVSEPRKSKAAIVATVAIEVCLLSSFLFLGSNLVGVATQSYNSGSWDGKSLVNVFEVGGDNAQQYAELAKAMAHGQLYLEEEPPQWLQDSNDPYDKGARDEMQKETGEPYLFDVAYYNGHYYVYFGVVPVILFYLPFYLLTGANFPTAIGVLIAVVAFVLGCSALLDRFARYHFKRVSLGLYLLLQIPLVMCCGVLYLLKFPTFYSLPIALGLAFSVWGLYFWMKGRASAGPEKWYLAGSLCMALVAGCRPQLLVLSLVAFPLFWRAYIAKRRLLTPRGAREFACLHRALPRGGGRPDGVQPCALRLVRGLRGELQPHGERHDEARVEHRAFGSGAVRVLPAAAQRHGRVPVFAAGAVRYHVHGADHQGSHLRRHLRVPAGAVGAAVREARPAAAHEPALHAHHRQASSSCCCWAASSWRWPMRRWPASCNATSPTSASCSWPRWCCSCSS